MRILILIFMSNNKPKNDFWDEIENSYPIYPTVKHRKRFILKMLKKFSKIDDTSFIFDYGCGDGAIISQIMKNYNLSPSQISGSDTSLKSIEKCKKKTKSPLFYQELYPELTQECDAIICSEVIEHASNYKEILKWIFDNLKPNGILCLSTQGGKMYKIDEYSGHVHTFNINKLASDLEKIGFKIIYKRSWGFPFFTLQKYLTNFNFDKIKNEYLEGNPSKLKQFFFQIIYLIYFTEDLLNSGPQLYITAKKNVKKN